jgi:transposase
MFMSARFVNLDRQTPMFLPCDLREWLPADPLVHFILDAVEQMPTSHFRINHRGTGSEQYPPTMMLALLIYCYATGRFGSRTIEAATHSDVAVRYLCANHHPDHDSICVFRTANRAAFQAAFVTVLQLARQLRLTRVGTVSVDGTKVQANASKPAAVSYRRAGGLITQLQLEVQELVARAEQADTREAKETLDIPAELARRETRLAALKQARQVIEARAKEMATAQQAEHQAEVAARQAQRAAGKKPRGPEPTPPSEVPDPKAQYNFTDPESRIMKAGSGQHFEHAYNAQAAVNEVMLIVGQRVSDAPNDQQELVANMAALSPVVAGDVAAVLVDSGFYSAAAVQAVEQKSDGPPSGLTVYAAVAKQSHHKTVADLLPQPEPVPLAADANPKEKMAHRLQTSVGKQLYKLRKQTVGPVFGIIKSVLGFRQFLLRGREKASLEWLLVCVSYNFKRLFTRKNLAPVG